MDPFLKDIIQIAAWCIAIIAGIVTAFKALYEIKKNRELRDRELKWNKAKLARELIQEFESHSGFSVAHQLIVWSSREYQINSGKVQKIDKKTVLDSIRIDDTKFSDVEIFIRDRLIKYFHSLSRLEHFIVRELVDFEDVKYDFEYSSKKISEDSEIYYMYLKKYHSDELAVNFLNRFKITK